MPDIFNQPWKLVQNRIRSSGGREIDRFRGKFPLIDDDEGSEAWIGSVTKAVFPVKSDKPHWGCSEVVLPDGRQMFLFEAIALDPEKVLGKKHLALNSTNMGMLIKLLDAKRQYALQAHPNRSIAQKKWNSKFGKEESWYVLGTRDDTPEPPFIYLGFKEGVTRQVLEELYRKDDMPAMEALCHKIPVKIGETYFIGAGLPHALGAGCFVLEVQEPNDITVVPVKQDLRLKMLHKSPIDREDDAVYEEKLFSSFIYNGCDYEENLRRWHILPRTIREGPWGKESFLISPRETGYFSFTRVDMNGRTDIRATGFPQVAVILRGLGILRFPNGTIALRQGDEVFLPYALLNAEIEGNISIVFCHPEGACSSGD
jgi:mannose-6-phosphate isomerase